ncbi:MAG: sigma-70 family RNA polymerase sigma factor [Woeseiaceae bacterium]
MTETKAHIDRELVQRLLEGDEAAFRIFFTDNFARLFRFAVYRLNGDEALAEDVVQRSLCKAVDKLDTYRGEAALYAWLCTFCRHEIGAALRQMKRSPVDLVEDLPEVRGTLESLLETTSLPEHDAVRSELARLINVTMDSLPVHYADALEWKYIDGLTVAEIAERQGRGRKAAESMLNRARESFRESFATLTGATLGLILEEGQST